MSYKRTGNKWTVNEILALQREYELLKLSVQEMSIRHKRSETAIMYKLDFEGFIDSWSDVKGFDLHKYQKRVVNGSDLIADDDEDEEEDHRGGDDNDSEYVVDEDEDEDEDEDNFVDKDDYEQKVSTLSNRVWSLETSVSQIGSTVKQIFDMLTLNKLNKNSESLNME
jgi:hypothetical protein